MIQREPDARDAKSEFFSIAGEENGVPVSGNPVLNADGAPPTYAHPDGQLLAAWKPSEDGSGTNEWWRVQDRAKPMRLQHAIWHCGSANCASREISGAGPNSMTKAKPIARRTHPAACRVPIILSKYTTLSPA